MDFSGLKLNQELLNRIDMLNWLQPTSIQEKAIPAILSGQDVVICSQTGTGKTAAFLLPILHLIEQMPKMREPSGLILVPTRELATQILELATLLSSNKIRIVNLCGGMAYLPQTRRLRSGVQLIIATPGRLIDFIEKRRIHLDNIKFLILDEADKMLNKDFMQSIRDIQMNLPLQKQIILVSATCNANIQRAVHKWLKKPMMINLTHNQLVPESIKQYFYLILHEKEKFPLLLSLLKSESIQRGIIFVSRQSKSEALSQTLNAEGYKTLPLHGKLKQNKRNHVMSLFQNQRIQFIITTDLVARGIDIQDLDYVINFDIPKTIEKYIHRIGRVGRNDQIGTAITFTLRRDQKFLKRLSAHLKMEIHPISTVKESIEITETLKEEEKKKFCNII